MNKTQLVDTVAERLQMSRREAHEVVEAVIAAITESVAKGERVAISGFGIFEQVFRQARIGRNPRTGETVRIGAMTMPKFRPGRDFKNLVSGLGITGGAAAEEPAEAAAEAAPAPAKKAPAKKAPAKRAASPTAAKKAATSTSAAAKKAPARKAAAKKTAAPAQD